MTTSYELSLKLKELGVEQKNGEYYIVDRDGSVVTTRFFTLNDKVLCRAFTLGELVRELPDFVFEKSFSGNYASNNARRCVSTTSPEEAAGELLAEIKSQELKQKEG